MLLGKRDYARAETVRDETVPTRYFALRHWSTVEAARVRHTDPDALVLVAEIHQMARVATSSTALDRADGAERARSKSGARGLETDRRFGFVTIVIGSHASVLTSPNCFAGSSEPANPGDQGRPVCLRPFCCRISTRKVHSLSATNVTDILPLCHIHATSRCSTNACSEQTCTDDGP